MLYISGRGLSVLCILGTVVIVGMLAATAIAILIIPVSFYLVEKVGMRFSRNRSRKLKHKHQRLRQETEVKSEQISNFYPDNDLLTNFSLTVT